jgi:DNA-binding CsgD family transcriptional regulator
MDGVATDPVGTDVQRAHRRLAAALEAQEDPAGPRTLARHWLDAADPVNFARHAMAAAAAAGRAEDHDEQAALLEALLANWDDPGVASAAGAPWAEVAVASARAHRLRGAPVEAASRARQVLENGSANEPLAVAAAWVELAGSLTEVADPQAASTATDAVRFVRALPDDPESSRLLALAVGVVANFVDDGEAATAVAEAARRAADWQLDDVVARSDTTVGTLLAVRDPVAAGEAFDRAREAAERLRADEPTLLLRYYTNAGDALRTQGRADAAAALATAGLTWAVDQGFNATSGAHLAATLTEALLDAGRLREARGLIDVWQPRATAQREQLWLLALGGRVDLLLGDVARARSTLAYLLAEADPTRLPSSPATAVALLRCEVGARALDSRAVVDLATGSASDIAGVAPVAALRLLTLAASHEGRVPDRPDGRAVREGIWNDLLSDVHPSVAEPWVALSSAWRLSSGSEASRAAWDVALSATRRTVPLSWRVAALLGAGGQAAASGRVARAARMVADARELVDGAGASGLLPDVESLEDGLRSPATAYREPLSPRELSVLRLLATGASNDDAARALAISTRTVEVHVASVMRKLGAASRGGAVAAGVRRGILEEDDLRAGDDGPG